MEELTPTPNPEPAVLHLDAQRPVSLECVVNPADFPDVPINMELDLDLNTAGKAETPREAGIPPI